MKFSNAINAVILTTLMGTSAIAATVDVQVTNLRNQEGKVIVAVFDQAGYPKVTLKDAAGKELKMSLTPAEVAQFQIDLAPGEYSIGVIHDANENGKLDGVPPKEGGSFTNGIGFFGPKKWEKSKSYHQRRARSFKN